MSLPLVVGLNLVIRANIETVSGCLLFSKGLRYQLADEKGTAMMEFMVVVPLLLFLSLALFDCGRALNAYISVSQIAHEGVRRGSSTFALETGNFESNSPSASCATPSKLPPSVLTKQAMLQQNTQRLLAAQTLAIDKSDLCIESGRSISGGPGMEDTVYVRVETSFDSLFPFFNRIPIRVAASGPYLFADDSSSWGL